MNKKLKALITFSLATVLTLGTASRLYFDNRNVEASGKSTKNVILLIPDGMGIAHSTLARWYQGGQPLAMDEMATGLIRTYSADAAIADSAPAGTAYATGHKSHTGFVGVLPDKADMPGQTPIKSGEARRPVASILEAAKFEGKSTGLIATSEITHATPADFSAHYPSRKDYNTLGEQMVYNNIDVVLGGGYKFLTPEGRTDNEDLIKVLKDKGYDIIDSKDKLKNTEDKVWGLFAPEALKYDIDRGTSNEPTLEDMTKTAIEKLSKDKDGFFLMVEGSKIDWASHANDPVGVVTDVLAFDKAVKAALDFAKKDKNTVVIVAADHSNGGMSMGNSSTSNSYDKQPLSSFITPLKKAKLTGEGLESVLNTDRSNIKEVMEKYFGINNLTEEEIAEIKSAKKGSINYTVGPMISKRANIGWTTNGHTGEEVPLYVYHPKDIKPSGVIENTDLNKYMAEVLSVNLAEVTNKLFIEAKTAFEAKGATVTVDSKDINNLSLVVTKDNTTIKFPQNKNIAIINGTEIEMPGVTVYTGDNKNINITKWYLSEKAISLFK